VHTVYEKADPWANEHEQCLLKNDDAVPFRLQLAVTWIIITALTLRIYMYRHNPWRLYSPSLIRTNAKMHYPCLITQRQWSSWLGRSNVRPSSALIICASFCTKKKTLLLNTIIRKYFARKKVWCFYHWTWMMYSSRGYSSSKPHGNQNISLYGWLVFIVGFNLLWYSDYLTEG
jgi:hypothetical protein